MFVPFPVYQQYLLYIVDILIYMYYYVGNNLWEEPYMATEEMKSDRFKRIAENRTNRTIEAIRLLGNCANRSNYSYTEEDVKKIFSAIEAELKEAKQKFQTKPRSKKFEL